MFYIYLIECFTFTWLNALYLLDWMLYIYLSSYHKSCGTYSLVLLCYLPFCSFFTNALISSASNSSIGSILKEKSKRSVLHIPEGSLVTHSRFCFPFSSISNTKNLQNTFKAPSLINVKKHLVSMVTIYPTSLTCKI